MISLDMSIHIIFVHNEIAKFLQLGTFEFSPFPWRSSYSSFPAIFLNFPGIYLGEGAISAGSHSRGSSYTRQVVQQTDVFGLVLIASRLFEILKKTKNILFLYLSRDYSKVLIHSRVFQTMFMDHVVLRTFFLTTFIQNLI